MRREYKRWTSTEDAMLLRQIRAYPQNLNKCFLMISEEIDRSPGAVATRWYTVLSKSPNNLAFCCISPVHISKNRKVGEGQSAPSSIWNRFLRLIRNL